jgi:hypothetical protein
MLGDDLALMIFDDGAARRGAACGDGQLCDSLFCCDSNSTMMRVRAVCVVVVTIMRIVFQWKRNSVSSSSRESSDMGEKKKI